MNKQRGIISMITTIMVSILLITLALGLIILLSGTIQQSSDDELSQRAYGAAEGGVEWATVYLRSHPGAQISGCDAPGATGNADLFRFSYPDTTVTKQNTITCLRITSQTNQVTGVLGANDAKQIMITGPGGGQPHLQKITVSWINPTEPGPTSSPNLANPLPSLSTAAAMELTVVRFTNTGGTVNPGAIQIRNAVLLPSLVAGGGEPKINATCGVGLYRCTATITATNLGAGTVADGEAVIVNLRARYLTPANPQVHYQLQFINSNGVAMTVPDQNANIDVTARAGSIYRRIIAQVPINAGVPGNLNYVLFGDKDVCKAFSFFKDSASTYRFDPSPFCPTVP